MRWILFLILASITFAWAGGEEGHRVLGLDLIPVDGGEEGHRFAMPRVDLVGERREALPLERMDVVVALSGDRARVSLIQTYSVPLGHCGDLELTLEAPPEGELLRVQSGDALWLPDDGIKSNRLIADLGFSPKQEVVIEVDYEQRYARLEGFELSLEQIGGENDTPYLLALDVVLDRKLAFEASLPMQITSGGTLLSFEGLINPLKPFVITFREPAFLLFRRLRRL